MRSLYWEAQKSGATLTMEDFQRGLPSHHNQDWVQDTWSHTFGAANMLLRPYTPEQDTVADFVLEAKASVPVQPQTR